MTKSVLIIVLVAIGLVVPVTQAQVSAIPDAPFKLATFATNGPERVGLLIDGRLLDLQQANAYVVAEAGIPNVDLPTNMRA